MTLHAQLAADTAPIGETELCLVLLMNDRRFPWLVLVPKVEGARELWDLDEKQRASLMEDAARIGKALIRETSGDKLNVAALGNVVPQLHVHVIARKYGDAAWPKPVWGVVPAEPYAESERTALCDRLRRAAALRSPEDAVPSPRSR